MQTEPRISVIVSTEMVRRRHDRAFQTRGTLVVNNARGTSASMESRTEQCRCTKRGHVIINVGAETVVNDKRSASMSNTWNVRCRAVQLTKHATRGTRAYPIARKIATNAKRNERSCPIAGMNTWKKNLESTANNSHPHHRQGRRVGKLC